jgi:hypothetical protein
VGNLDEPKGPTFVCSGTAAGQPLNVGIGTAKRQAVELEQVGLGRVLIDSGATDCFVNPKWLEKAGYNLAECLKPCGDTVKLADLSKRQVMGRMSLSLKLGQFKGKVNVMVLDIGSYDLILGDTWLIEHNAVMDYRSKSVTLRKGSKRLSIRPKQWAGVIRDVTPVVSVLTAKQGKRLLPKAIDMGWIMVRHEANPELQAIGGLTEEDPHLREINDTELRALVDEFIELFGPIPPHSAKDRGLGPAISLEPGASPTWRPVFKLTLEERAALSQQIKEMLEKGWIEPSSSPYGAPVLFVRKKDGSLRLVIDYRALNRLTVKNRYPLPRIDDLLDIIGKAKYFTSLDLTSGYHQILISQEDIEKTAFRTPIGHYQWKVLSMGLTNAPSVFQMVMNKVFGDLIGKGVVVYMDDILIFSKTREDHLKHIRQVFEILRKEQLYCKLPKCEFMKTEISYLGHIIDEQGVHPDPRKIKVVETWPRPTNVHELRAFLGMCNYFRRFIKGYAKITYPMTELLRKGVWDKGKDPWLPIHDTSFEVVKHALTTAPVLTHYDPSKPMELICDASKVALGGILLQEGRPLAYESRKFSPTETRYSTGDRELLAVIHCLKVWRCYLHGQPFTLVTDHKPNTYLRSLENWSDRQARWNEKLEHFSYVWEYRRGEDNIADPLSRLNTIVRTANRMVTNYETLDRFAWRWRSRDSSHEDPLNEGMEHTLSAITRQMTKDLVVGPTEGQDVSPYSAPPLRQVSEEAEEKRYRRKLKKQLSLDRIVETYDSREWKDELARAPDQYAKRANGLWYKGNEIVLPPGDRHLPLRQAIIAEHHDTTLAGHPGFDRLKASIKRTFWWPGLHTEVLQFSKGCVSCARSKVSRERKAGLLYPQDIPDYPWQTISMDFICGLPQTLKGEDTIAVFVDKLTKMVHLCPCINKGFGAEQLVDMFMREVFRHHGVPRKIISDRDPKIVSAFWREVIARIGSKCNISTSYHPQTDGQTEVFNKVLEEMLRNFVSPTMTNWAELLPACEFAINDHIHSGTQYTPFYLNYGRHPVKPIDLMIRTLGGEEDSATESDHRLESDPIQRKKGKKRFDELHQALQRARGLLLTARAAMEEAENRRRRDLVFTEGDKVWLSSRNFTWKSGSRKLCPRWIGPYEITEVMGPLTYRLKLPTEWQLHDVFHVSLLKPFTQAANYQAPAPVKVVDGEPVWEVEEILKYRQNLNHTLDFLIHWKGFGPEWQSWQPEHFISKPALARYWHRLQQNPDYGMVDEPAKPMCIGKQL